MKQIVALCLVSMLACVSFVCADDAKSTTLKTKDGKLQLVAPAGWASASGLNDQADIQATSADKGLYLVVLADNKADLADSLEAYGKGRLATLTKSLTDVKVSDPKKIDIGGKAGYEYEIHGTFESDGNKVKIGYFLFIIETDSYFIQLFDWGTASHFDSARDELEGIGKNLTEIKK